MNLSPNYGVTKFYHLLIVNYIIWYYYFLFLQIEVPLMTKLVLGQIIRVETSPYDRLSAYTGIFLFSFFLVQYFGLGKIIYEWNPLSHCLALPLCSKAYKPTTCLFFFSLINYSLQTVILKRHRIFCCRKKREREFWSTNDDKLSWPV